jgi:hypothetical protein
VVDVNVLYHLLPSTHRPHEGSGNLRGGRRLNGVSLIFRPSESALTVSRLTIFDACVPASVMVLEENSSRFGFSLITLLCKRPNGTSDAGRTSEKWSMTDFRSHWQTTTRLENSRTATR